MCLQPFNSIAELFVGWKNNGVQLKADHLASKIFESLWVHENT